MKYFNKILSIFFIVVLLVTGCKTSVNENEESQEFEIVQYTIVYKTEYGTVPASKEVDEGYKISSEDLPVLTEPGYVFGGWDVDAGFEVKADIVITAIWTPATNTTFNISFTAEDITVTPTVNEYYITFIPSSDYSNYTWTLNGQELDVSCIVDAETHALKFYKSRASYGVGNYVFTLKAVKDGITYTTSEEYYVEKAPTKMGKWDNSPDAYYSIIDGKLHISGTGAVTVSDYGWSALPVEVKNASECIIEDGITEIQDYSFKSVYGLTKVSGGKNVTKIGYYAFMSCDQLTTLQGFQNLREICKYVFLGTNLTNIMFGGTEEQWNALSKTFDEDWDELLINANVTYNNN